MIGEIEFNLEPFALSEEHYFFGKNFSQRIL